jgi:hypothetical protein
MSVSLSLIWVAGDYSVCKLPPQARLGSLPGGPFFTIARTSEELSIVCVADQAPEGALVESPFALFRVEGTLPLGLTGILSSLLDPLRDAGIPIFALSTFDTDYVLVRSGDRDRAQQALIGAGHRFAADAAAPG